MKVEIDRFSGFCFGVVNAIKLAERELEKSGKLYCLGDIVHNNREIERLEKMGLIIISNEQYYRMKDCKVLIRAHGQPPEIYDYAAKNNIEILDATCPVVLNLQQKIRASYKKIKNSDGQIVIFGKNGHAEVIALNGQIDNNAIIIESLGDVDKIDFFCHVSLYSQTTKRVEDLYRIAGVLKANMKPGVPFEFHDTVCRQVSNRVHHLKRFAVEFDLILFVAGKKSSNGKYLYSVCKEINSKSYYISGTKDIDRAWLEGVESVGITGATSTPAWLMEEVCVYVKKTF